jgi:mannose-6-phosphate isomerase-like protein (cupin superfamily)
MSPGNPVRRVVTTVDSGDKAVVLFDGDCPHVIKRPDRPTVSQLLWVTGGAPADISGPDDRAALALGKIGISPPPGGSVFRIVDFPPLGPEVEKLSADHMHHQLGGEAPKRGLPPSHPFMHRTRTIDYAIVMHGEIDMLLDDSEIHLKAGDVLVQQGTNHAWVNRGKETCRIAFILIDSKEP